MEQSRCGNLLVASSLISDPVFAGGVCLVVHQDENVAIGVMLNRPLRPAGEGAVALLGGPSDRGTDSGGNGLPDPRREPSESQDEPPLAQKDAMLFSLIPGHGQVSPWRQVHFGGPLSGPLVAIHQESDLAEAAAGTGIYVAVQKQSLEALIQQETVPYRLIVGHLGWKPDQLEHEIKAGVWHTLPATAATVFSPADEMWQSLIRRATANSLARWIGIPDHPAAHELN